jgi:hypothetical protein
MLNILKRLLCKHKEQTFIRNIYGDEIIDCGYKRSVWRCTNCDAIIFADELHQGPATKALEGQPAQAQPQKED